MVDRNILEDNKIVQTVASMLSIVCFVLIIVDLMTNLGQMRIFRYAVGELSVIAAIVYATPAARTNSRFVVPVPTVAWFALASLYFAMAIFFATN